MRVVHFAQFGPRACGLYETVKDLIIAERHKGLDARLVDIDDNDQSRPGLQDGPIRTDPPGIAWDADILIRHTAIPTKYQNIGVPIIMCLHGRPESSYRLAAERDNDVPQALATKAHDARYKAFVTFWPEHKAAWRTIVGGKLHVLPAPVDLAYYAGGTDKKLAGSKKILIADMWRDDMIPLNSLIGAARFVERFDPAARIHAIGLPSSGKALAALQPFLRGLKDALGSVAGQMRGIRDWYASCDVVVTPHTIATRVIRESLAAGVPIVAGSGCCYTPFRADPCNPDAVAEAIAAALADPNAGFNARQIAETYFNADASAEAMIDLCRSVIARGNGPKRKVLLDIGAHTGESVRRFYRQRSDADEFEIYCFEPDPDTFDILFRQVGAMPNVHCFCAALSDRDGERTLHCGTVNQGEGSTFLAGKQTGGLQTTKPVATMAVSDWFARMVRSQDYCIVKMNVEGAEYELLPAMTSAGLMDGIDELYVQWHSLKFNTARRIELDRIELAWWEEMKNKKTHVFATTKGMESFGLAQRP